MLGDATYIVATAMVGTVRPDMQPLLVLRVGLERARTLKQLSDRVINLVAVNDHAHVPVTLQVLQLDLLPA